jgi:hypothetical protein
MGLFQSKHDTNQSTIVLQTGKMRAAHIKEGVKYLDDMARFPAGVVHRFLPSELESKYEAMDFIKKFGLNDCKYINIYNGQDYLVELTKNTELSEGYDSTNDPNLLVDKVNVIVACGSSSMQAFKITPDGGKILLPISYINEDDTSIRGNKSDPNLSVDSLANFGGSSINQDVAVSVLNFLKANAFIEDESKDSRTNVVFVNQLGYSIKGFNPRGGAPHMPTYTEKVVSLKYPILEDGFTTNGGKTALVEVFQKLINGETFDDRLTLTPGSEENMMYLVARQCKVDNNNKIEELAGQWANMVTDMISNEPYLQLDKQKKIGFILDLGGSSGTLYSVTAKNTYEKVDGKTFMKTQSPNDLKADLDEFFSQFTSEYETLFD